MPFQTNSVWAYNPDAVKWTKLAPEGDPMPTGGKRLAYLDPALNAVVVIDGTTVWPTATRPREILPLFGQTGGSGSLSAAAGGSDARGKVIGFGPERGVRGGDRRPRHDLSAAPATVPPHHTGSSPRASRSPNLWTPANSSSMTASMAG